MEIAGEAVSFPSIYMPSPKSSPLVAVIMGSKSDVLSAHRTPDATADFARTAAKRGVRVIIAGAGAAAHLAGAIAGYTWLPVLGVPIPSSELQGLDSLLSTAQMPGGVPVGTLAIGAAGAKNAALLAASIIALSDDEVRKNVEMFRKNQTKSVLASRVPK